MTSSDNGVLHQSERDFQRAVVDLATASRWTLCYHTLNSRGSASGFPDLVLVRVPELIFAELKTDKGRVSDAQHEWLRSLEACGVETYVWRPSDWATVEARLTAPRPTPLALAA